MHRTDGQDHVSNLFVDGPPGTIVEKHWLNAVQEELAGFIESRGISLVKGTHTQLTSAITHVVTALKAATNVWSGLNTFDFGVIFDGIVVSLADSLLSFTGTQPLKTDALVNMLTATNLVKAWGKVTTDGLGGAVLNDGFNVASVAIAGSLVDVTLAGDMANANYAVSVTPLGFTSASGKVGSVYTQAAGSFTAQLQEVSGGALSTFNMGSFAAEFHFIVIGRQ